MRNVSSCINGKNKINVYVITIVIKTNCLTENTDYSRLADHELVSECLKNNRQAQQALYQKYVWMMKGICLRYASSEIEAEDILQDAFIRGFKSLDKYSGTGPLGAWLRKITVNTALEQYRKNKSLKQLTATFEQMDVKLTTEDDAIETLALDDLLTKIQLLPPGFRTVFNLYAVEGYNHKEIGHLLSISEGTSKSQYSRARIMLRAMIERERKDEKKILTLTQKKSDLNYAK